ncbi:uncharacterized protein BDR25DRAFT_355467 [Lindgomyces ingoldianus]|uniref:Uncharacterized protein n=1 Tax=Lindgomyces ingoldianus TaxID=673940 RepID=A0ACB6QTM6_9PLEO|nr:uncharacterized protein BDR25DRAFT_355467 [Lindgomyces ingoldianus]KAF2470354.1 hypothetical protein BDR25DRAFT_355467 [Lindgomyces ingoldianus]
MSFTLSCPLSFELVFTRTYNRTMESLDQDRNPHHRCSLLPKAESTNYALPPIGTTKLFALQLFDLGFSRFHCNNRMIRFTAWWMMNLELRDNICPYSRKIHIPLYLPYTEQYQKYSSSASPYHPAKPTIIKLPLAIPAPSTATLIALILCIMTPSSCTDALPHRDGVVIAFGAIPTAFPFHHRQVRIFCLDAPISGASLILCRVNILAAQNQRLELWTRTPNLTCRKTSNLTLADCFLYGVRELFPSLYLWAIFEHPLDVSQEYRLGSAPVTIESSRLCFSKVPEHECQHITERKARTLLSLKLNLEATYLLFKSAFKFLYNFSLFKGYCSCLFMSIRKYQLLIRSSEYLELVLQRLVIELHLIHAIVLLLPDELRRRVSCISVFDAFTYGTSGERLTLISYLGHISLMDLPRSLPCFDRDESSTTLASIFICLVQIALDINPTPSWFCELIPLVSFGSLMQLMGYLKLGITSTEDGNLMVVNCHFLTLDNMPSLVQASLARFLLERLRALTLFGSRIPAFSWLKSVTALERLDYILVGELRILWLLLSNHYFTILSLDSPLTLVFVSSFDITLAQFPVCQSSSIPAPAAPLQILLVHLPDQRSILFPTLRFTLASTPSFSISTRLSPDASFFQKDILADPITTPKLAITGGEKNQKILSVCFTASSSHSQLHSCASDPRTEFKLNIATIKPENQSQINCQAPYFWPSKTWRLEMMWSPPWSIPDERGVKAVAIYANLEFSLTERTRFIFVENSSNGVWTITERVNSNLMVNVVTYGDGIILNGWWLESSKEIYRLKPGFGKYKVKNSHIFAF